MKIPLERQNSVKGQSTVIQVTPKWKWIGTSSEGHGRLRLPDIENILRLLKKSVMELHKGERVREEELWDLSL